MKIFNFLVLISFVSIFAQNKKLDSLNVLLKNNLQRDTVRVDLLNKIASNLFQNDKELAINFANEALIISDSLTYLNGKAEASYVLSKVYTIEFKLDKADEKNDTSISYFKKTDNKLGVAKCINNKGVILFYGSNYDKALEYFYKAIEANKTINDKIIMANAYNNVGIILDNKNELKEALKYYNLALEIHRKNENYKYMLVTLNNMGGIYIEEKKYKKANALYKESIALSIKNNDDALLSESYYFMGILQCKIKKYKKAYYYYSEAIKINKRLKNPTSLSTLYIAVSELYFKQEKYSLAYKFIKKSEVIVNKYSLLNQQKDVARVLANIYSEKKEYKKALEYHMDYKKYYDSIINIESINKLEDLKLKYKFKSEELLSVEKELELNKKIKKVNDQLNTTYKNVLYGFLLALSVIITLSTVVYRSRLKRLSVKNQKINLEQRLLYSQMKPHFIFNSLSVLQGIVLQKEFNKAQSYISKFSRLLRVVLEKSREETINLETELVFIENYILLRNMSNKDLQCVYNVTIDNEVIVEEIYIPPMILQPIVENSFEHAFIALNKNYILSINFKMIDSKLQCVITDNGEGYREDTLKTKDKTSISSTIIKERLELYAAEFKQQASMVVKDRKEIGEKGVEVVLILPYKIIKNA